MSSNGFRIPVRRGHVHKYDMVRFTEGEGRSRREGPREDRQRCPGKEGARRTGRRMEEGTQTGKSTGEWECWRAAGWA